MLIFLRWPRFFWGYRATCSNESCAQASVGRVTKMVAFFEKSFAILCNGLPVSDMETWRYYMLYVFIVWPIYRLTSLKQNWSESRFSSFSSSPVLPPWRLNRIQFSIKSTSVKVWFGDELGLMSNVLPEHPRTVLCFMMFHDICLFVCPVFIESRSAESCEHVWTLCHTSHLLGWKNSRP